MLLLKLPMYHPAAKYEFDFFFNSSNFCDISGSNVEVLKGDILQKIDNLTVKVSISVDDRSICTGIIKCLCKQEIRVQNF